MLAKRMSLLTIVLLLLLADGLSFAQDVKRLRYGVSTATTQLPIWAAKEGGIFSKYGLDVEVILMRGGPLSETRSITPNNPHTELLRDRRGRYG